MSSKHGIVPETSSTFLEIQGESSFLSIIKNNVAFWRLLPPAGKTHSVSIAAMKVNDFTKMIELN
jgi:hypothetical protein